MRTQAIPLGVHRRRQWMARARFPILALLGMVLASGALIRVRDAVRSSAPEEAVAVFQAQEAAECPGACLADTQAPDLEVAPPGPPPLGSGVAFIGDLTEAGITNIEIAISFIDGTVIPPGARFSFDDSARTWDYGEDERYVMSTATSVSGLIAMRGGGVCWVSTALWRAALAAGLRTEHRESHMGLVDQLGPGLDATNTLVIRNDSTLPVTVRTWLEGDTVVAALIADEPLDRTVATRGPVPLGPGRYVLYRDVTWPNGETTTSEFLSRYYW